MKRNYWNTAMGRAHGRAWVRDVAMPIIQEVAKKCVINIMNRFYGVAP